MGGGSGGGGGGGSGGGGTSRKRSRRVDPPRTPGRISPLGRIQFTQLKIHNIVQCTVKYRKLSHLELYNVQYSAAL